MDSLTKDRNKGLTQELKQAVIAIKTAILQSQGRAARMISGSQLSLYFGVGLYVSANSREGKWGTGSIDSISEQLHRELPGLRGFSAQNIRNMRQFAEFWHPFLFHSPAASKLAIEELRIENSTFIHRSEARITQHSSFHIPHSTFLFPHSTLTLPI